jgi:hypothetical protein
MQVFNSLDGTDRLDCGFAYHVFLGILIFFFLFSYRLTQTRQLEGRTGTPLRFDPFLPLHTHTRSITLAGNNPVVASYCTVHNSLLNPFSPFRS